MPAEPIDIGALEIGRRYRVDWRHERLRRTFRAVGTLVAIEDASEDDPGPVLTFEVRPRFGKPALQHVSAADLRAIAPVEEPD
jgi:hypothetical protein